MMPRVMSGRSESMAVSMLETSVPMSWRAAILFCSTSSSLSRLMVRMVATPNPMISTRMIRTVILAVRRMRMGRASDARRASGPVGLAELAPQELARRVAREDVVEGDLAGDLVAGHVPPAEGGDLLGVERFPGAQVERGVHPLAPLLVGHPEDGGVEHLGVAVQHVLDLGREDAHARRDDHVALAVADVVEDGRDRVGHVAHRIPVAAAHPERGVGIVVVLVGDARAAAP